MRWRDLRRSTQVEDRRGRRFGGKPVGIGCGGIVLVILFALLTGQDPLRLLQVIGGGGGPSASTQAPMPGPSTGGAADEESEFVRAVLGTTEDVWNSIFAQAGQRYRMPKLILFTGSVASACGFNSAAVGPFYCPADQQVYIDLSFFRQLSQRFGAPGDFAQAYVIAHEVGHHVQNLLGTSGQVQRARQRASRAEGNQLSVRLELQADCYAGVWGHHVRGYLEEGDIEEGLRAAQMIGDDMMQRRAGGYVHPESWTHGSSEQRQEWLARGLRSGDPNVCDTFQ